MGKLLTSRDIVKLLRHCPHFIGVFPRNKLPCYVKHYPASLVINTDTANLPGKHWTAIYITSQRIGEFFDSLAQMAPRHVIKWLNQFTRRWTYTLQPFISRPLQHKWSIACGAFVIYFICERPNYSSVASFRRSFFYNTILNDSFVIHYHNKLLTHYMHVRK